MSTETLRSYLLARLREASTWRGLVLVVAACGATLSPEQREATVLVGLALSGIIGAAMPDAK